MNGQQMYKVTVRGKTYECLTMGAVTATIKFVAPQPCFVEKQNHEGKNVLMNLDEFRILQQACHNR